MKKLFFIILITALTVSFSAVAMADSSTSVIYGCYKKINGQLRIVSVEGTCKPSELPISWNSAGEQGTPGVANGISTAVHGLVALDGAQAGTGFEVAHTVDALPGNGLYDITFTTAFSSAPDCLITPINSSGPPVCLPDEPTTTSVTVHCSSGGAAADAAFEFLCVQ